MITTSNTYKTERIISLLVTHRCNLNCTYCFEKHKEVGQQTMSMDTACRILTKEFEYFAANRQNPEDRLAIEFFGGEPLINFDLIKEVYEWVKTHDPQFPLMFQLTSNGTLLSRDIIEWFDQHREDFRIVLSVDGDEEMHSVTRGFSANRLPLDYIANNWPNSYFKMTLSKDTLPTYSRGIINLANRGFRITSSLAEGIDWSDADATIYRRELLNIGNYYLTHPEIKVEQPFDMPFERLLYQNTIPTKNCGCATKTLTYDTDGTPYPCHLFVPIVRCNNEYRISNNKIDFKDDRSLIDDNCLKCPLSKLCRTCYGFNLLDRGSVKSRNLTKCKMLLVEMQVISSFQIQYFMQRKMNLTEIDLRKLHASLKAYQMLHSSEFNFA